MRRTTKLCEPSIVQDPVELPDYVQKRMNMSLVISVRVDFIVLRAPLDWIIHFLHFRFKFMEASDIPE